MHPRYAPLLFGFLLSGLMSFIVTGIAALRAVGFSGEMPLLWMSSWVSAWPVAFPTVLIVAPTVRRIVARLVREPDDYRKA
jgi:hypothetical protein